METQSLDIIEFTQHPQLLNNQQLSDAQITVLKSMYGLPLSDLELQIFQQGTGRQNYHATEQRETTLIAGRQGGKTTLSAIIACYEAFRDHGLPAGREGWRSCWRPRSIAFLHSINTSEIFQKFPILSKRIIRITNSEIVLDNNIVIACHSCTYDRSRGRIIVAVIADEIGFGRRSVGKSCSGSAGCLASGNDHGAQRQAGKNIHPVFKGGDFVGGISAA